MNSLQMENEISSPDEDNNNEVCTSELQKESEKVSSTSTEKRKVSILLGIDTYFFSMNSFEHLLMFDFEERKITLRIHKFFLFLCIQLIHFKIRINYTFKWPQDKLIVLFKKTTTCLRKT